MPMGHLSRGYPPYKMVHYHYHSWSARRYLGKVLRAPVLMKCHKSGLPLFPTLTVIDSQRVRTGLPHTASEVYGTLHDLVCDNLIYAPVFRLTWRFPESGCIRCTIGRNMRALIHDDIVKMIVGITIHRIGRFWATPFFLNGALTKCLS